MIFTKYPNDFWRKRKIHNFDPNNVLPAAATNIPVLLKTAFVAQGHVCVCVCVCVLKCNYIKYV